MLGVLAVHADFVALGVVDSDDFQVNFPNAITRTFFEFVGIECVNVFILISGWFGIRPSIRSFASLIFQYLFFAILIYCICLLCGHAELDKIGLMDILLITPSSNWFMKSYIGLYIIAPVLNVFISKATRREQKLFLVAFYIFQTLFGMFRSASFIQDGYSTFSFIGLYILASYLRRYNKLSAAAGCRIYWYSVLLNTCIYYVVKKYGFYFSQYNYISPFVITASVGLLIWFANIKISNSHIINWIAKSSFAVFLIHTNKHIADWIFYANIKELYTCYSGIVCVIAIIIFLIVVYFSCILLDQPRRLLWNNIQTMFNRQK